jgi:anaphase-promoting complex subunit 3
MREVDPNRIDGLAYYGTTLWQLKKKVHLSALGKQLKESNEKAPETW